VALIGGNLRRRQALKEEARDRTSIGAIPLEFAGRRFEATQAEGTPVCTVTTRFARIRTAGERSGKLNNSF
jgi:hypothetical protein